MVLVGLGLGAARVSARLPGDRHMPAAEPASLLVLGALLLGLTASWWPHVPEILAVFGGSLDSFAAAETLRWTAAAALLLPPAAILGMVYPSLFRLEGFPLHSAGVAAGRLVAANALGSIVGALATGFGLIPLLGSERSLAVLIALAAAIGAIVCMRLGGPQRRRTLVTAAAALLLVAVQPRWNLLRVTSGLQVYFAPRDVTPETTLEFFHEDTLGGFTTVVSNKDRSGTHRTLLTNGKFQGNDGGEMTAQTAFALIPIMFAPRHDDALSIGLGTGRTAFVLSAMGFRSVDIAEIAPGVVRANDRFGHVNGGVLGRPGTHLFLEDGRNVLLLHAKPYDVITIEITSVWFEGATNVYSREFYRLARERLRPGGVLQQWIQLHHIGFEELGTALATMRSVFPYVSVWALGGQGLLVGSPEPQEIQAAFLAALDAHAAAIGWDAGAVPERLERLCGSRLLAPEDTDALLAEHSFVVNSDRNRRLEYWTPRYNNVHADLAVENLRALRRFASFPRPRVAAAAAGPLADACRSVGPRSARPLGLEPLYSRR
jgi:spermidine synthase